MRRFFMVAAMLGVLVASDCADNPHGPSQHTPDVVPNDQDWDDLLQWLGVNFNAVATEPRPPTDWNVLEYLERVATAICNLENSVTTLDVDDELCNDPGTGGPDGEDGPPPGPPWQ